MTTAPKDRVPATDDRTNPASQGRVQHKSSGRAQTGTQSRLVRAILFCVAVALVVPVTAQAYDRARFLHSVGSVESRNRYWVVGPCGEVTQFQVMPRIWRFHTRLPISRASDPAIGLTVAQRHLSQLERELRAFGVEVTVYNLALAWRAGSPAVARNSTSASQRDHAQRIVNLYEKP